MFFHFVEDVEVIVGDGFGGFAEGILGPDRL